MSFLKGNLCFHWLKQSIWCFIRVHLHCYDNVIMFDRKTYYNCVTKPAKAKESKLNYFTKFQLRHSRENFFYFLLHYYNYILTEMTSRYTIRNEEFVIIENRN